jgi:hypothetical protein
LLQSAILTTGKNLLETLLLKREFELADALRNYTIYLPNTFIAISLATGNEKLLDFLLTHGECTINTFLIGGLSPVRFCFERHNSKFPKIECLSVLIKHGVSLMVSAEDGLPIAYHILTTIQHPLNKALLDNAEKTLARKGFYRALIKSLENKVEKMKPCNPIRQKVLNNIKLIDMDCNILQDKNSKIEKKLFTQSVKYSNQLSNNFEKNELLALQNDQEYQQALSDLAYASDEYYQKLSSSQKRQTMHYNNSVSQASNVLLKLIDLKSLNIKEEAIKYMEARTHQFTIASQLIDLQNKIKQSQFSPKRAQKLNNQQIALLREFNNSKRECPFLTDDLPPEIEVLKSIQDCFESFQKQCLPILKDLSLTQCSANDGQEQEQFLLQIFNSVLADFLSDRSITDISTETLEHSIQNNDEKSKILNKYRNRKATFFGAVTRKTDNPSEGCHQNNILPADKIHRPA